MTENHEISLIVRRSKVKKRPPNQTVRDYADRYFGGYCKYAAEVQRFVQEDAHKVGQALGNRPVLYHREKDIIMRCVRDVVEYNRQRASECKASAGTHNPHHILWYLNAAIFNLSEDDFSMRIAATFIPILNIGENGEIGVLTTTAHSPDFHRFGKLTEDPKLYRSLKSIADKVDQGTDPRIIRFDTSDNRYIFYKATHKIGRHAQQYFERQKLLTA